LHASRPQESVNAGQMGAQLEGLRQQLLSCGAVLARLVEPQAQPLVSAALANLAQIGCRIAVVGQIKSGKSSFINAFVRSPTFLPTSVTPWTTAVTNLHFNRNPSAGYRGVFSFFERTEWTQLAAGRGKIRELTERLVPGFEPRQLQEQAEILRARAVHRLGFEFESLLGKAHCFAEIGPGTLEQYICTGDGADNNAIGKYSDITKSADLYCGEGPFAFPSTIVDTPGTNDPFLIRDEITRQSLGTADIYIVVLTARQPLSDSDVALLRIMRGLNQDRIVVLINRIDDLSDLDTEIPRIVDYVRERLATEFPGSTIPVVYGSAWWAIQAMAFNSDATFRVLRRRSAGYLLRAGLLAPEELSALDLTAGDLGARIRQSLYAMSGLPAVNQAIDTLMTSAAPAYVLHQITRSFAEMARACESAARSELQILLEVRSGRENPTISPEETFLRYARERDLIAGVASDIEASAAGIESQLVRIIQEEQERLRGLLLQTVATHAARERDVLIDTLSRGRPPRVWTHEGVELRRALSGQFARGFDGAAERLRSFHARVVPELHRLMRTLVPEPDLVHPMGEALTIPMPTVTPVSRMLVLDLESSRWSAFWSRQLSAKDSGARMEALILAEFTPIADELVQLAGQAFHEFGLATVSWSLAACRNIQLALKRRFELLLSDHDTARNGAAGPGGEAGGADQAEHVRAQALRLKDNETLTQHLDHLVQQIEIVLKSEAAARA